MEKRKKVLILSYYWPPAGGPGVQRILKFVKYLGNYGWTSIIITPRNGSFTMIDESLCNDIPDDIKVFKTSSLQPFLLYNLLQGKKSRMMSPGMIGIRDDSSIFQKFAKYVRANLFIPDARIGWNRFALKQANKIIPSEKIDAIITTGPPHSTHLVGLKLKGKFGLPWIADFRDPWVNIFYNKYFPRNKSSIKKDEAFEYEVLRCADVITTVSHGLEEDLRKRGAKNVVVIPNGFDEDDIYKGKMDATDKFVLSHVGTFVPFLDSPGLWEAILELSSELDGFRKNFSINFIGKIDPFILENLKKLGLEPMISVVKYVPHKEATKLMHDASLLLFSLANDENNKSIVSGKLFEYLASTTPILSIGPIKGDAATILSQAGRCPILDYNDAEGIKSVIKKYYTHWESNNHYPYKYSNVSLEKFSRRELTKTLAGILDNLAL